MKPPTWGERVCISLPLPHGSVLRIDSFWMRIKARKQNIWLLPSSRLPEWEAVNWHFGVVILISAEYSKMEKAQLFMQSEMNLKKKSLTYFFWRKQDMLPNAHSCTFTILMQHWGIKGSQEFCLMKRKMWVNTLFAPKGGKYLAKQC